MKQNLREKIMDIIYTIPQKREITEAIFQTVKEVLPKKPLTWDSWSIERQIGYNRCFSDIKHILEG